MLMIVWILLLVMLALFGLVIQSPKYRNRYVISVSCLLFMTILVLSLSQLPNPNGATVIEPARFSGGFTDKMYEPAEDQLENVLVDTTKRTFDAEQDRQLREITAMNVYIKNYLGDRPLAAYSHLIAECCYFYGMDPYWFCSIAIVESGGGAQCFRSFNAWGYGDYSWNSWEESIPEFTRLFVSNYGEGLNNETHLAYCPSGAYYEYLR